MLTALYPLALLPAVLATAADESALPAGTQLTFQGAVAEMHDDRTPGEAQKVFDLTLVVAATSDSGAKLFWHVEENGRGRWQWPERFGTWSADAKWKPSGTGPSLLYDYDGGDGTVIPLLMPLISPEKPLAAGLTWTEGKMSFEVTKAAKFEDRDAWEVRAANNYGPQYTALVDKQSPLVLSLKQRVFMGMGREHQLEMRLVGQSKLDGEQLAAVVKGFETMLELRAKLGRQDRSEVSEFSGKQLAVLAEGLPRAQEAVTTGSLQKVVTAARRELSAQSTQAESVEKLSKEFIGRKIEEFALDGIGGAKLSSKELSGNVTVLHFWDYRDSPLKVPYGQTGYLDFLHQQRQKSGVKVFGVAVDTRLADEAERPAALRSIRKFRMFMNLGYGVLLDEGKLIKQLGDPRQLGAELPLFVVVGADGKIAHYHVGNYEVDATLGLKELDAAVGEALAKKEQK
ncbi:MAG: TlpA family protein disulfide reductase [Planctomycetia bacterium]|nr:TlpA family protein disulfide reductase [Planctomycetia bacterium]